MESTTPLVVFSDDWGRHPTSCQHLVAQLLDRHRTVWVNTIGMRRPRLEWYTLTRGIEKLGHWLTPRSSPAELPAHLNVINPVIWPGFSNRFERRLNARLLTRSVSAAIESCLEPPVAVTTMPVTVDLIGRIQVRRWVYYCVDDFSTWPGLDHAAIDRLERELIDKADRIVAVSEALCERVSRRGRRAELLTHGVDIEFWKNGVSACENHVEVTRPLYLFWGLIDRRMDTEIIKSLSEIGTVMLVGPEDNPDPNLKTMAQVRFYGPVLPQDLPALARSAEVLILPYADLPVTRAIQPLKLKEYLATGKPVVAQDLPAVRDWADCLDIAATPGEFAATVRRRVQIGVPPSQTISRQRLTAESWSAKAKRFREILFLER